MTEQKQDERGEQLKDGEASTLAVIASLNDDSIERYKQGEKNWEPLVKSMRDRLHTGLAKKIAKFLLNEETEKPITGTADDKAAYEMARIMMINGRPGFAAKIRASSSPMER